MLKNFALKIMLKKSKHKLNSVYGNKMDVHNLTTSGTKNKYLKPFTIDRL